MRGLPKSVIVAVAVAAAATVAACSSSSGISVTLNWWNNATVGPLKGVWVSATTAYHPRT